MWRTTRFIFGPLLFLTDINDIVQAAADNALLLYVNDTCPFFQPRDIKIKEEHLNQDFLTLVNSFLNNKLSVHFGGDKIKIVLFSPKHRNQ